MSRVAAVQPDLFVLAEPSLFAQPPDSAPTPDPAIELEAMLEQLRVATQLPWPDLATTMAHEYRALALARQAGPAGEVLAAAILDETERLLSASD